MTTISGHTTRGSGTILTAAIYNADHVNHVTNAQALNATKLEGATPPVVDGHAVLWSGTSGAALRTAGYVPANAADLPPIIASDALKAPINNAAFTGTFSVPPTMFIQAQGAGEGGEFAMAKPPVGSSLAGSGIQFDIIVDKLRIFENGGTFRGIDVDFTTLAAGLNNRVLTSNDLASQAQATAGADNTKVMTPLRTAQAIAALVPPKINAFTGFTNLDSGAPWNTGVLPSTGGLFLFIPAPTGSTLQCSANGGTNFTNLLAVTGGCIGMVFIRNNVVAMLQWHDAVADALSLFTLTAGAGNIVFRGSASPGINGVQVL